MSNGQKKEKGKRNSKQGSGHQTERGLPCNGFETIVEATALACDLKNVHPLTLPQEALVFEPAEADIVCLFKNGDKERKIHNNIELHEDEKENLAQLQKMVKDQGLQFFPSITAMATRFLSRARGDPKKAIQLMQATQAWRLDYFKAGPISDEQVKEDLKYGIVYFTGRDSSLRPTIVVRPRRIPQEWYKLKCIDRMIKVLIFCMEYMLWYMMIPGRIENTNVIVDLKTLGISQLPIGALSDIYKVMSHHYIGRVFKFYVVNLSWVLNTISGAVKAILTDRQKQKLNILDDVKELQKDFALHQLEEDLGGTRPVLQDFFPFQMPPGPFSASSSSGPVKNSMGGGFKLLAETKVARQGVLWDPKKSRKENTDLIYSDEAYELFQKCNYPIPPNCPQPNPKKQDPPAAKNDESSVRPRSRHSILAGKRVSNAQMRQSLKEMGICSVDMNLPPGEEPKEEGDDNVNDNHSNGWAEDDQPKAPAVAANLIKETDKKWPAQQEEKMINSDEEGNDEEEQEATQVKPGGWFFCRACSLSGSR